MWDHEHFGDLIRRVRAGENEAAAEIVRHFEEFLRVEVRVGMRRRDSRLRRAFDSLDICQSVFGSFFVRVALGQYELDQPEDLVKLLVTMAKNKLAEQARFHQRQGRDVRRGESLGPEHEAAVGPTESPSQLVARQELLREFRAQLSEEERQVVDLRAAGQDWATIAAALGGTPESRRKQFARALNRVSRKLGLAEVAEEPN